MHSFYQSSQIIVNQNSLFRTWFVAWLGFSPLKIMLRVSKCRSCSCQRDTASNVPRQGILGLISFDSWKYRKSGFLVCTNLTGIWSFDMDIQLWKQCHKALGDNQYSLWKTSLVSWRIFVRLKSHVIYHLTHESLRIVFLERTVVNSRGYKYITKTQDRDETMAPPIKWDLREHRRLHTLSQS